MILADLLNTEVSIDINDDGQATIVLGEWRNTKELVAPIIKCNPHYYDRLSDDLKKDKKVILAALKPREDNSKIVIRLLETIDDKDIALALINADDCNPLRYFSDSLRNDRDILVALTKRRPCESQLADLELANLAISADYRAFSNATKFNMDVEFTKNWIEKDIRIMSQVNNSALVDWMIERNPFMFYLRQNPMIASDFKKMFSRPYFLNICYSRDLGVAKNVRFTSVDFLYFNEYSGLCEDSTTLEVYDVEIPDDAIITSYNYYNAIVSDCILSPTTLKYKKDYYGWGL